MASVLNPLSVLPSDILTMPHQRRPSVAEVVDVDGDIIDVDQYDEFAPSTSSRSHPREHSREIIVVTDSDDEGPSQGEASGSGRRPDPRPRLLSPPPPARGLSLPPPVPQVPHRFSAFTGLVSRRQNNARTPPVIRPIERPFELGARPVAVMPEHPNRHRRVSYLEPRPEPEPQHVPALGLGGAIVAVNDHPHHANSRGPHNHRLRYLQNHIPVNEEQPGVRRYYTLVNHDPFMNGNLDFGLDFFDDAHAFGRPANMALQDVILRRRDYERPPEAEYKVEYTHSEQPEPGFTFSFAQPDPSSSSKPLPIVINLADSDSEDGPVTGSSKQKQKAPASPVSSVQATLICARCLDPLVLGGSLIGDEVRRRKVWALRCGHMIDGKCLDVLGAPNENGVEEAPVIGKGKGKAKEVDYRDTDVLASAENTVRSRLRSRVPPPPVPTMGSSPSTSLGKRKRPVKQRIEATHQWTCPVKNCGREHVSVKIDGTWVPEPTKVSSGKGKGKRALEPPTPGRGAIAVFV
ncbi:hypothetical protein H0H87_011229 [Tephrocybe sp. NHM501043]|nr:hypothetical protein H0H87_011229 [Tephrocybe sp. NHM501043]